MYFHSGRYKVDQSVENEVNKIWSHVISRRNAVIILARITGAESIDIRPAPWGSDMPQPTAEIWKLQIIPQPCSNTPSYGERIMVYQLLRFKAGLNKDRFLPTRFKQNMTDSWKSKQLSFFIHNWTVFLRISIREQLDGLRHNSSSPHKDNIERCSLEPHIDSLALALMHWNLTL